MRNRIKHNQCFCRSISKSNVEVFTYSFTKRRGFHKLLKPIKPSTILRSITVWFMVQFWRI
ncbi:hypothetical protein HanRHA438_Chr06g0255191 [Helianthus annuus]|nr:hypothetical protein HanIR_Chr06g0264401 [Helianthus annuus]KAJ0910702.1 hypothetical protein HanRHA438_Chr06g0255191 [Helianthus annuus]